MRAVNSQTTIFCRRESRRWYATLRDYIRNIFDRHLETTHKKKTVTNEAVPAVFAVCDLCTAQETDTAILLSIYAQMLLRFQAKIKKKPSNYEVITSIPFIPRTEKIYIKPYSIRRAWSVDHASSRTVCCSPRRRSSIKCKNMNHSDFTFILLRPTCIGTRGNEVIKILFLSPTWMLCGYGFGRRVALIFISVGFVWMMWRKRSRWGGWYEGVVSSLHLWQIFKLNKLL